MKTLIENWKYISQLTSSIEQSTEPEPELELEDWADVGCELNDIEYWRWRIMLIISSQLGVLQHGAVERGHQPAQLSPSSEVQKVGKEGEASHQSRPGCIIFILLIPEVMFERYMRDSIGTVNCWTDLDLNQHGAEPACNLEATLEASPGYNTSLASLSLPALSHNHHSKVLRTNTRYNRDSGRGTSHKYIRWIIIFKNLIKLIITSAA